MKVPFLSVPGVEFVLINGSEPPLLQAQDKRGRWSAEIRFWKARASMIVRVIPNDSALPDTVADRIRKEVDAHRAELLAAAKPDET